MTHKFTRTALGITSETVNGQRATYNRDTKGTVISEKTTDGSRYNLVTDQQGSVIGLLGTDGQLAATYRYTPYGNNVTTGAAAAKNPIRWIGGYRLQNNLCHFGYRYYNPNLGRFSQPDPTGQEANPYTYAQNDPINSSDLTGAGVCSVNGGSGVFG